MTSRATSSPADEERFRIDSSIEILASMRDAMVQGALLTLRVGNQDDVAITTLLAVDAAENRLVLDACAKPDMTAKVMAAHNLTVDTEVRRIRICFESDRATAATHDGRPALHLPIPAHILRIQRRDA